MTDTTKQCGDCSLCCKLLGIPELKKPKDAWCPNFVPGTGCGIYADRPPSCRNFVCRWLVNPTLGPEWKPNVCKMVLDYKTDMFVVHVDPAVSRPWRAEPYYSTLRQMAAQGLANGTLVMIMERGHTIILLPDRELDMGIAEPNARFQIKREMTAQGMQWEVRMMAPQEVSKSNK
jgi:hypothetical protein